MPDPTAQDRAAQDRAGQDRAGQDRAGQDRAGRIDRVRVVGAGVMGRGIAQLVVTAGIQVEIADAVPQAVADAVEQIHAMLDKLVAKGRLAADRAAEARARLHPLADPLAPAPHCDLVIEAVREALDTKRALFADLERICPPHTVFATNTSSLSVTEIAAGLTDPGRLVGLHFFNPVPLMRLVEVVAGARTAPGLPEAMTALVRRLGHEPVRAPDTPGFLVNHAGRGLVTEALQLLAEAVATPADIDRVARDVLGLRMGPFELLDLTGLDVSHPVLESIWRGFHAEPRLRPSWITGNRMRAGLLGRKTGAGFYRYDNGVKQDPPEPVPPARTPSVPVWVDPTDPAARDALAGLLATAGVRVAEDDRPPADAVVLATPFGRSAASAALDAGLPVDRVCGVDPLGGFGGRLTLAVPPSVDPALARAAWAALAATGRPVTLARDVPGAIAQRLVASVVNTGCFLAEQRLAGPADIDTAVRLGLGYPRGPLEWGQHLGPDLVVRVLAGVHAATGDPRYRPSAWLVERARLGLALTEPGTQIADLIAAAEFAAPEFASTDQEQ